MSSPPLELCPIDAPVGEAWDTFAGAAARPDAQALRRRLDHFAAYGRCRHWLACRGGQVVGRLSAIVNGRVAPAPDGATVGFLGHLLAPPDAADRAALARAGLAWLAGQGVGRVRAPVNLSTWYENRLPGAGHGADPPFFSEPPPEPATAAWLAELGFARCWSYVSTVVREIRTPLPQWAGWQRRFAGAGGRLRPFDPTRAEQELRLLHRLSNEAFAGNFCFSSIDFAEFADIYRPLLPLLVPELALFALDAAGAEAGFCFCLPDPTAPARLLVKSLGVMPRARRLGTGTALVAAAHARAAGLGCSSAVHVLMNQASASRQISAHGGEIFREYELFERRP